MRELGPRRGGQGCVELLCIPPPARVDRLSRGKSPLRPAAVRSEPLTRSNAQLAESRVTVIQVAREAMPDKITDTARPVRLNTVPQREQKSGMSRDVIARFGIRTFHVAARANRAREAQHHACLEQSIEGDAVGIRTQGASIGGGLERQQTRRLAPRCESRGRDEPISIATETREHDDRRRRQLRAQPLEKHAHAPLDLLSLRRVEPSMADNTDKEGYAALPACHFGAHIGRSNHAL